MMSLLEGNLFALAYKVEELLGPIMDAVHTLEADQPMLSYEAGLYDNLHEHFEEFSDANPHPATGGGHHGWAIVLNCWGRHLENSHTNSEFLYVLERDCPSMGSLNKH